MLTLILPRLADIIQRILCTLFITVLTEQSRHEHSLPGARGVKPPVSPDNSKMFTGITQKLMTDCISRCNNAGLICKVCEEITGENA